MRFWADFSRQSASIAHRLLTGMLEAAFKDVERLLLHHGYEFCFELTVSDGVAVMVLTPEGDPDEAESIDALLEHRPEIPGWQFFGRRQRKPLQDVPVFVRHIFDVDVSDVSFVAIPRDGKWRLILHSRAVDGLDSETKQGLAMTYLDHALGEAFVMRNVLSVEAQPASKRPKTSITPRQLLEVLEPGGPDQAGS